MIEGWRISTGAELTLLALFTLADKVAADSVALKKIVLLTLRISAGLSAEIVLTALLRDAGASWIGFQRWSVGTRKILRYRCTEEDGN